MLVYLLAVRHTLRTDGAPNRTRTDTGRILSPSWELSSCQNIGQLSAAQARVLAIVRMCMHLCMHS